MRKFLVIFILICALATAGFVFVRNRVQGETQGAQSASVQVGEKLISIYYANTYLSLDKNGMVCDNSSAKPSGLPVVDGVEFTKLIYGKKAQPVEESALDYVLKVAKCLEAHDIAADTISYANRMVNVYIGKLEIQLGKNVKTEEKINDLDNFIDKIDGASGTLYMQNANANNYGYTFRAK